MYQVTLTAEEQKQLKKIIRQMMIKKEISVTEMADRLGCSRQYLYNYMSGKGCNQRSYRFLQAALIDELEITVGAKK